MTVEELNTLCKNTMIEYLGIEFIEISDKNIVAKMPVDNRTIQPMKKLHGGAILTLAETIGSAGSTTLIDNSQFAVFGVEINATHIVSTTENEVFGMGTIIHQGKNTHVWEIKVEDKTGKLLSICRLTNRIVPLIKK
ncbi:putative esterase [uncultured Paludibacter sp.]|nr:putative esterase [uncultured Paludibacter sp.]